MSLFLKTFQTGILLHLVKDILTETELIYFLLRLICCGNFLGSALKGPLSNVCLVSQEIHNIQPNCTFCLPYLQHTVQKYKVCVHSDAGFHSNSRIYWLHVYGQLLSSVRLFATPWTGDPPGSSAHGISQARILEWAAITFSRGSSWRKDLTCISCIDKWIFFLNHRATWEAQN